MHFCYAEGYLKLYELYHEPFRVKAGLHGLDYKKKKTQLEINQYEKKILIKSLIDHCHIDQLLSKTIKPCRYTVSVLCISIPLWINLAEAEPLHMLWIQSLSIFAN